MECGWKEKGTAGVTLVTVLLALTFAACVAEVVEETRGTPQRSSQSVSVDTSSGTSSLTPICNGTSGTCDGQGKLDGFFNWTQFQGHLSLLDETSGMMIPPNWLTAHPDFPYQDCMGQDCSDEEFLFAKNISFSRFLGGYDEDQLDSILEDLEAEGICTSSDFEVCRYEVDLCQKDSTGKVVLERSLIRQRLQKYLDAGYEPRNLVVKLDNIPWALAREGGHSCDGCLGQIAPPERKSEWSKCVNKFFKGMRKEFGDQVAEEFLYAAGTEFNAPESFDGDFRDFTGYLSRIFDGANSILPNARVANGEFSAAAVTCGDDAVYCLSGNDKNLPEWLVENGYSFERWPRSENAFLHSGKDTSQLVKILPYGQVKSTVDSYQDAGIPFADASVWQLTLRGQTFAADGNTLEYGSNRGAKIAAWRLQMLMGLKRYMDIKSVNHYGAFTKAHGLDVMDGEGFVLAILNHLKGCRVYELESRDLDPNTLGRKKAYMFRGCGGGVRDHILVSDMSMHEGTALQTFEIKVPPSFANVQRVRHWDFLRYSNTDNVWTQVKNQIVAVGEEIGQACLRPPFLEHFYTAVSESRQMTTEACQNAVNDHFNNTLTQAWFDERMDEDLRLTRLSDHDWNGNVRMNSSGNTITVEIRPNEVQVFRLE